MTSLAKLTCDCADDTGRAPSRQCPRIFPIRFSCNPQALHTRSRLAFQTGRPRIQGTRDGIQAKLTSLPCIHRARESTDLSEQRPAMQPASPAAPRDPRLNAQIDALLSAHHSDPFSLLGPHSVEGNWAVRFFLPWAAEASISLRPPAIEGATLPAAKVTDAIKLRPQGFFEASWPSNQSAPPAAASYKIQGRTHYGESFEIYDPYAFPCVLSEFDLYLMGEGRHYDTYEKLGAHVITLEGVRGVHFAVWAPSARRVSVVGDFNGWDGRIHPMRARGASGLWEVFLPEL